MIKVISTDMDGTFLNTNNDYNRERFEHIYKKLKEKNIKFIVASGNQYFQLKSFFPGKDDYITYVSENGAIYSENGSLKYVSNFDNSLIKNIIHLLNTHSSDLEFVLCGVKNAYLLSDCSINFKNFAKKYYYNLIEVPSFDNLPDDVFVKFALDVEIERTDQIVEDLNLNFTSKILAVSSGHGSIDIVIPGINKGSTISMLLQKWGIKPNELLSFGDANNDLEMLELTKHSFAMRNGNNQSKNISKYIAPSNDESGVLDVIERYIEK